MDVKDVTEPFQEDTGASLSSLSSDESSDLEGGYVLMENKKASVLELLPDFKPANDDIKYKHTFCPNTRLSTLRNIDKWMNRDEDQPRCMVIKAAPGMGKTSLLKEVCSKYSLQLLADHFFSHCSSNLGHSDLRQVVLSLAHSFTEKLDNYVGCLPTLEEVKQIIYCGSTEDVLDTFIYSALNSEGLGQEEDRKMIMVIDALDDCNFPDREVLFRFINEFTQKAPKWLYLLVSIRDENQLTSLITSVSMLDLCDNAENMADLKKVMKESLSPFMDRISLDGGLTQLAKKCKGLALTASLYNRMLNGMDRKKGIALREIDVKFPTGMNGVLRKTLKDFKSLLDREADASYFYNTLLGMLCYAREPIPVTFAKAIDLRNAEEVWKALNVIVDTHGQREDTKSLHHKSIAEWLLNDKLSEEFQLDGIAARNEIGRLCVKWITPMLDQMPYEDTPVFKYALKHSVSHLTDIPKQQENIGNILCSLKATQMKLEMNGVSILQVVNEYNHTHSRIGDTKKEISLKDYMKKVPKLSEQLNLWYTFLSDNQIGLFHSPKSVYQLAANYVNRPRVQQNARVELAKQPWLEDISTGLADNVDLKVMPGEARLADVSPDGKTVAVVYGSCEDNLQLVQYNSSNLEEISNISIASLEDRKGLCCKFLPDNANVFVGSLVKYVGKKGKIVSTDLDMKSLQLKQKYMVECCAVSSGKYLATSLSTFPFGGRSVHLAIFGFKEKKVVKMLEVLNFRFGGSANFGIRCCAFSPDEKQMAACVKDSNKNQLKVNVWNTVKWNVALTLEVGVDNIRKCHFFESDSLILDVKMVNSTTYNSQVWPCQKSAQPTEVGREKSSSVSSSLQSKAVVISWDNKNKGQIHLWKRGQSHKDATKYRFSGMQITDQVVCCQSTVLCFSKEIMQIFNVSDSEPMEKSLVELDDLNVQDITFMPRSDMGVLSHVKTDAEYDILSIFNCDSVSDEISVKSTKVPQQSMVQNDNVYSNIFQGANKPGKKCYVSHDGKYLVMCCGNRIALWNYQTGKLETMPFPDDMDSDQLIDMCIPSGKESMVAVVYKQQNHKVVLFDLRTKKELRRVGIDGDPVKATVTDMTFMPYTGAFISYHRNMDHRLVVWNQSNGSQRSASSCKINFCRVSSSSDRFILCCRKMESGHLQLRNSDAKFSQKLQTPESWSFQRIDFDLEFSLDGTVLAGVQSQGHMTRIWNAANGDILKDFTLGFIESPSIAGMITNTHMAIYDGRILVIDIASAELLSVTPLPQPGHGKHSISQLSVSSRGNIIAAVYNDGAMTMLKCHNFSPAKMTTTLQRMKSFSGLHG